MARCRKKNPHPMCREVSGGSSRGPHPPAVQCSSGSAPIVVCQCTMRRSVGMGIAGVVRAVAAVTCSSSTASMRVADQSRELGYQWGGGQTR